jgi:UDP-glucose-4-epimerase GalE
MNNDEKAIVVTGGSGFIGSNVCELLVASGYNVFNIDRRKREMPGVTQYPFEINTKQVKGVIDIIKPECVIHIAANNSVPNSVINPKDTYHDNVEQTISLLNVCVEADVKNFMFTSSSSVYGNSIHEDGIFKESDPTYPGNPYGRTKQICERIIKDYAEVYDMNYSILRLFNVAGSNAGKNGYQKSPYVHVLPIIVEKALTSEEFEICGDDYDTPDGTCLRDYTHISDIARGFLLALHQMFDTGVNNIYNLGNGDPVSVLELIEAVEKEIGEKISTKLIAPRKGDMVQTYADITLARNNLGWEPTKTINDIIVDEIAWQKPKLKRKHNL